MGEILTFGKTPGCLEHTRRPVTPRRNQLITKVDELIDPVQGGWDEMLVRQMFWEQDAKRHTVDSYSCGDERCGRLAL